MSPSASRPRPARRRGRRAGGREPRSRRRPHDLLPAQGGRDADAPTQLGDAARGARAYLAQDALPSGPLLRGSRESGELVGRMSVRAIRERVRLLGEAVGLFELSPHDCRHYWATYWASRVSLRQLQQAGGWASPAMPLHYARASEIANEGMA